MSEFLKCFFRNPIFISIFATGSLAVLEEISEVRVEKYSERGYVAKNFNLSDSLMIKSMQFVKTNYGYSFAFSTNDENLYYKSDEYFDSENNDRKEIDKLHTNNNPNKNVKRRYSDKYNNFYVMISVTNNSNETNVTILFIDKKSKLYSDGQAPVHSDSIDYNYKAKDN